ncbi:lipocalin family protein [Bordetella avium]|uniref:Outer membrane lipoprotein Blc n=1 Tax=Bordetella avium (strain 197N) TaxID=360910 RepID=Q2KU61_BORA1|nr:lipocalin family protein [Bordetella avium]AZY50518.1 hypothetical protein C0J09_16305 [Bordetella avium]AZY53914.1 hypothetical protein C0J07_16555 [Bordetella avium]RIQ15313.1 hypothetical protein D0432_04115 [Bordetella avium]RIQ19882.1 hypothetical protein D0850_01500 [Bordetella avium]RIQ34461.1 hypothetical protein D0849_07480 [Bordetella avium]
MRRLILSLVLLASGLGLAQAQPAAVRTVDHVDLDRYMGRWYEIAHLPMFFQRNCVGDTTAEYSQNTDGTVSVTNRCRTKNGSIDAATGTATVVADSGNAKLEVSFFRPFKGDYWIIGLDPEYRWAVVGSPNRKTLWVLARTPELAPADLQQALNIAKSQGYDLSELKYTEQR